MIAKDHPKCYICTLLDEETKYSNYMLLNVMLQGNSFSMLVPGLFSLPVVTTFFFLSFFSMLCPILMIFLKVVSLSGVHCNLLILASLLL